MAGRARHKIPVYFIRMAYNKSIGDSCPIEMWKKAVERTGGRFYAAADENTILEAVHEIDRLAPGRIDAASTRAAAALRGCRAGRGRLWSAAALLSSAFRSCGAFLRPLVSA